MMRKASSEHKRRTRGGRGKGREMCTEKDGICILPDEILCHIVSFLPTKDAVRASILSKRWRYFWTSVTSIDIDDASLLSSDWERLENPELKGCFMDFVDRVLRLNDVPCLRNFSLNCDAQYDISRVTEWIGIVITRNVEVLDLRFNFEQEVEPPPSLYTCRKLRSLKLSCLYLWDLPTLVCLPSLKILHLHCRDLRGEDVMKNLLGGCPVLEELDIITGAVDDMKTLFVRSSSLKNLRIDHQYPIENEVELGIVIDAKNLERLDLICDVAEQCDLYNLTSLVEVKLDYCWCPDPPDDYGNKSVELLRIMSNTKYMCLYYYTMKTLEHARLDDMPMFHNLTHLELHVHEHSWQVLPALLESSPNLITFIFCTVSETSDDKRTLHQKFRRPKCLMLYLEEVKLLSFKGGVNEMKMVSYFLKSAAVLKKMSIQSYYSGSKNEEILKRLILFSRSSTACQIVFN